MITEKMAKEFETYFARHLPILLKKSGLDLKIASIGGGFNEEGILLKVAAIPKSATKEQLRKFLIDRKEEADGLEIPKAVIDKAVADTVETMTKKKKRSKEAKMFDLKRVGLSSERLRELAAALPYKYEAGTIYLGKKGSYALIGFSVKRDGYVLYAIETSEKMVISKAKFKSLDKM